MIGLDAIAKLEESPEDMGDYLSITRALPIPELAEGNKVRVMLRREVEEASKLPSALQQAVRPPVQSRLRQGTEVVAIAYM